MAPILELLLGALLTLLVTSPTLAPYHIYNFEQHFMFRDMHEARGTVTLHISIRV